MDNVEVDRSRAPARRLLRYGAIAVAVLIGLSMLLAGQAEAHSRNDTWEQRKHIKRRARSVTGSPYRYGGTSRSGFDCSGFTRWSWYRHGANLPHSSMDQFRRAKQRDHKRIWKRSRLKIGDLVFHKTTSARVGHVGIYIGRGKFVSSTSSSGVRVRSLYDSYWGPRWVGATRLPAVIRG